MKVKDKRKFISRILELISILASFIITSVAINYVTSLRGYEAVGGEFLIPILGLVVAMIIETAYEETRNNRGEKHTKA